MLTINENGVVTDGYERRAFEGLGRSGCSVRWAQCPETGRWHVATSFDTANGGASGPLHFLERPWNGGFETDDEAREDGLARIQQHAEGRLRPDDHGSETDKSQARAILGWIEGERVAMTQGDLFG